MYILLPFLLFGKQQEDEEEEEDEEEPSTKPLPSPDSNGRHAPHHDIITHDP
jgi:hypothetical protein